MLWLSKRFVYGFQNLVATSKVGPEAPIKPSINRSDRAILASPWVLNIPAGERVRHMPSLIRFFLVVGVLGAAVYGGLYAMQLFFEPVPRETSQSVQGIKIPR
jgi:hypothetical protein